MIISKDDKPKKDATVSSVWVGHDDTGCIFIDTYTGEHDLRTRIVMSKSEALDLISRLSKAMQ